MVSPSLEILSPSTTDKVWLTAVRAILTPGLVDSRGIAIQKHGKTGGLSVTFVKDRVFTNKAKKGKNIKHYNFRTTKIGGTVAAKKFAGNKKILARVSRLHQSASHFKKTAAAKKAAN